MFRKSGHGVTCCSLLVEYADSAPSPCHVWQHAKSTANQESSPEPWGAGFLLGVSHLHMAECSHG